MRFTLAFALLTGFGLAQLADAGQFNRKLSVGDQAPAWVGLPGTDGKSHSLADLNDKDVVVVVFTCNHCPVAVAYEDRIINFANKHAGPDSKVALVAINVNNIDQDRMPKMKERAAEKGFPYPYVYDESQKIGRQYGATVTPEFFVLNKERKVVYMGAMDNNMNVAKASTNYLEPAVEAALHGQMAPKAETRAMGCSVKYENK
jgi:peroxiredoxin